MKNKSTEWISYPSHKEPEDKVLIDPILSRSECDEISGLRKQNRKRKEGARHFMWFMDDINKKMYTQSA
jgi:hypothetical protein